MRAPRRGDHRRRVRGLRGRGRRLRRGTDAFGAAAGAGGLRLLNKTAKPNRKRVLTFKLKCSKSADDNCFGTAELKPTKGKRIGKTKAYAILRGQTIRLRMTLSKKLAKRAKTKRVTLELVLQPAGDSPRVTRTVTVGKNMKCQGQRRR